MVEAEVRDTVAELETLLERLDPAQTEAVDALLRLYGETLRRIVAALSPASEVAATLAADELVAHMLLLHDLELPARAEPIDLIGGRCGNCAAAPAPQPALERCELCGNAVPDEHGHLFDREAGRLLCACRACALLFDHGAAGGTRYRLVPARRVVLDDLRLDDAAWRALGLPVEIAYFVRSGTEERVVAYYPSPAGAVESLLALDAWADIERENPVLRELVPDVEALLVNRAGSAREAWIVGIDACYRLVGIVRTHWRGLGGGPAVRTEIDAFFQALRAPANGRAGRDR